MDKRIAVSIILIALVAIVVLVMTMPQKPSDKGATNKSVTETPTQIDASDHLDDAQGYLDVLANESINGTADGMNTSEISNESGIDESDHLDDAQGLLEELGN